MPTLEQMELEIPKTKDEILLEEIQRNAAFADRAADVFVAHGYRWRKKMVKQAFCRVQQAEKKLRSGKDRAAHWLFVASNAQERVRMAS